jgi:DNA-binding NarL/FixJ family response regulator
MLKPRIILIDDHHILLDAIKSLVEPEFHVVGIFESATDALEKCVELRPDIIVLDIGMPSMNGISAGEHFKRLLPKAKLIYLTMNRDLETAAEAFRLGASGYVLKTSAGAELIQCIREVLRGGYYASSVLTKGMIGSFVQVFKKMKSPHELTTRQKEVLQLLAEGNSMKQVANKLDITPRTVAFHKYSIMQQLNIKSNAELMTFAASHLPGIDPSLS